MPQPTTGLRIGRILGIPLYLHATSFLIFALLTFFLATQILPLQSGATPMQYWILAVGVSIVFFGSLILHELGHSVISLRYKIPVISITLFFFGGLARIARDPKTALQEFNIAIAGPIVSFILGAVFLGVYAIAPRGVLQEATLYLSVTNLILGAFNLLPGFPMDGGRVLRAIVWGITKNFDRATQIASRSGQVFAYMMIMLGIWAIMERDSGVSKFLGGWSGGLWLAFIGWYLLSAAQETYTQVAIRHTLTGLSAADIMSPDVPTVARDISLEDYVHEVLRTGRRCHVVTGNGMAVGLVTLHQVQHFPREEWANTSIQAAMVPQGAIHWVMPNEPVTGVLERMQSEDVNQMPVLQEGHIIGMIARDSILRVIQTRLQAHRQYAAK